MPRVVAQTVVACVFVELMQRGEIEDLTDQIVDGFFLFDKHHAVVDQFGGKGSNDVYAKNAQFILRKDKL